MCWTLGQWKHQAPTRRPITRFMKARVEHWCKLQNTYLVHTLLEKQNFYCVKARNNSHNPVPASYTNLTLKRRYAKIHGNQKDTWHGLRALLKSNMQINASHQTQLHLKTLFFVFMIYGHFKKCWVLHSSRAMAQFKLLKLSWKKLTFQKFFLKVQFFKNSCGHNELFIFHLKNNPRGF